LIEEARKYNFKKYINLVFYKDYSPQVLKANMRIVGNSEYALLLYREKLPKFINHGHMVFNSLPMAKDTKTPKIHPTQKSLKASPQNNNAIIPSCKPRTFTPKNPFEPSKQ
jgi:site-specific DNA-methyltransferase (adenine-specific)